MASANGKNRNRRPRPRGLIAAYGFVLTLTAVFAVGVFGIAGGAGNMAPRGAAASLALPPSPVSPSKPSGSLSLPPRPSVPPVFRVLPDVDRADLVETTTDGQRLPKISASGWMPWMAYARRFKPEGPPARVGLLMINLGADETLMTRAIDGLPGEVSLAFLPGTPDLPRWLLRARKHGHESYLMLPVDDPGSPAERGIKPIEKSVDDAENLRRLRSVMARGEGYVGLVIPPPGLLSTSRRIGRALVQEIAGRGLGLVEINPGAGVSSNYRLATELGVGYARSSGVVDYSLGDQDIEANLDRLVEWVGHSAPDHPPRHAFVVMQPDAAAIDVVAAWRERLVRQKTVSLIPIIGHFECSDACLARARLQPAQLQP